MHSQRCLPKAPCACLLDKSHSKLSASLLLLLLLLLLLPLMLLPLLLLTATIITARLLAHTCRLLRQGRWRGVIQHVPPPRARPQGVAREGGVLRLTSVSVQLYMYGSTSSRRRLDEH